MKNVLLGLFICFVSINLFAQNSEFYITGKVIDAATTTPLQAASVFAQNTTIGTATDTEGKFSLRLPNGGYDLVITFTGYETVVKRITTADADNKNVVIEVKVKDKSLQDVVVKSSNEVKNGWQVYGDFFLENFVGKSINSKQCLIKNKDAMKFYFSKRKNRLKVIASEPLEIENKELGYKIKYTLDSFIHEYNTQITTNTGFLLFEELPQTDSIQIQNIKAKRAQAYNGSILHFMRSVYNKSLKEEGFEIQFLVKNNEADTSIQLLNYYGALNYDKDDSTKLVYIDPNQPDIAVLYNKEKPESGYMALNPEVNDSFQFSELHIPSTVTIAIEQNGYYYDQNDIVFGRYWDWEKVADMLPYDYKPE